MKLLQKNRFFLFCAVGTFLVAEQSFVIKKEKKRRPPSMNKLKEQYAQNVGELIKIIPKIQRDLAKIHQQVIYDLNDLLNNVSDCHIATLSKDHLDGRSKKIVHLSCQLEKFDELLKDMNNLLKSK